ncbi:MAG: hypothetical protein K9G60_02500 [Pseudolabrys sp.]|nr:hypothetical protein [Pseudolabrys sp.]
MTRIIVQNGDWAGARAKLKTNLETQHANFQAKINAALGVTTPQAEAEPAVGKPQTGARLGPATKQDQPLLPRSRLRR